MVFRRGFGILVALFALATVAAAQSGSSAISGLVRDTSGGAVPGAAVKVINEETGVAVDTVTNESGLYRVSTLLPGRYRVEVTLEGFRRVVRTAITLEIAQTLAIDVTLELEGRTEAIDVVARAPLVESQSSNVAHRTRATSACSMRSTRIWWSKWGTSGIRAVI